MSRIRLQRTEAIVLKRHDYAEADRILVLYTPQRGKLWAIAKGVRRIASRKSGHVELFTHANLLLAEGRNLDVVTQADTVNPFRRLRDDLVRLTYAYHIAELVDRFTEAEVGNVALFELLRDSLALLEDAPEPALVARAFELHLMSFVGYQPQLFACVNCSSPLESAGNAFSPEAGGALCPNCTGRFADAQALSEGAFKVLRFLQIHAVGAATTLQLGPDTRAELERHLQAYVRHLLERDLNSVKFLRGLRPVAAT